MIINIQIQKKEKEIVKILYKNYNEHEANVKLEKKRVTFIPYLKRMKPWNEQS